MHVNIDMSMKIEDKRFTQYDTEQIRETWVPQNRAGTYEQTKECPFSVLREAEHVHGRALAAHFGK